MRLLILVTFCLSVTTSAIALTIGAYNIRNFDYDERYRIRTNKSELSKILNNLRFDVLSVEEISNTFEWDKFVHNQLPHHSSEISRCGGAHGQKLGFLYNTKTIELLSFNEDLSITNPGTSGNCDSGSRPAAIGLFRNKSTGQKFYGITVHLKSGSAPASIQKRSAQLNILKKIITELKSKTGVKDYFLAGDFNTTEYLSRGADYKLLTTVVNDLGMIDLSANLKCSAYYWGGTNDGIETPSLLDHVIVTPGLVNLKNRSSATALGHCQKASCREVPIAQLGISYSAVSDHCPITAVIQ